jgi:iron-sulfur cluster assembly protein
VVGGGCSGLSYEMDFSEQRPDDRVIEFEGFRILLDPKSTIYLKGITLDFQDGLQGKGFIFSNPNARNTCGCGESFAV